MSDVSRDAKSFRARPKTEKHDDVAAGAYTCAAPFKHNIAVSRAHGVGARAAQRRILGRGARRLGEAVTREIGVRSSARRGALLLEIVVAMTIMIAAMAIVGGQLVGGLQWVAFSDHQTRAGELADRIMALLELDKATQERLFLDRDATGDFGDQYPEFMWRAYVEPTDTEGLGSVTVQVLYQPDEKKRGDATTATIAREVHLLKADPGRIDFVEDFGMEEEQVNLMSGLMGSVGIDPLQFNPQDLVSLPPETLMQLVMQLMPLIQQAMGGQMPGMGGGMPVGLDVNNPDAMREFIERQIRGTLNAGGEMDGGGAGEEAGMGGGDFDGRLPELGGSGAGGRRGGGGGRGNRGGGQMGVESLEQLRDLQNRGGEGGGGTPRRGGGRRGGGGLPGGNPIIVGNGGGGGVEAGEGGGETPRRGRGGRGARGGRSGGGDMGGGGTGEDRPLTIEDLNRLRDELNSTTGGRGGGGRGGRGGRGRG